MEGGTEMTQREAKIEALRISVALLNNIPYMDEGDENDEEKIVNEIVKIKEILRIRAEKLGGDFNQYTGY